MASYRSLAASLLVLLATCFLPTQARQIDDERAVYVLDLSLTAQTSSIYASWTLDPSVASEVTHYEVSWQPPDNGGSATSSSYDYTIEGLSACTTYTVSVQPINSGDLTVGDPAVESTTTGEEDPPRVATVTVYTVVDDSSSLNVSWDFSDTFTCDVTFRVTWDAAPADGTPEGETVLSNEYSYIITGLTTYTTYTVCVASQSSDGTYSPDRCADGVTDEDVPGSPASVTVEGQTSSSIQVSWEAPTVTNGVITQYEVSWTPDDGSATVNGTTTQLDITDLQPCTTYTISVTAATSKGAGPSADTTGTTDSEAPGPVTGLQVDTVQDQSSQLQACWTPPVTNCDLQYNVTWSPTSGDGGLSTTSDTCFTITGLTPFTTYSVCVAAGTLDDEFGAEQCANGTTDEDVPGPPANVSVVGQTSSSIQVSWEAPTVTNGVITQYEVSWTPGDGSANVSALTTQHDITGLQPCTTYTISVTAATSKGAGPSADTTGATDSEAPGSPTQVTVTLVDGRSDSLDVAWVQAEASGDCPVLNNTISWSVASDGTPVGNDTVAATVTYTIGGLEAWTNYTVCVAAVIIGDLMGPTGDCPTAATDEDIPEVPENIVVGSVTSDSIELTWDEPTVTNGIIMGYNVTWSPGDGEGWATVNTTQYTIPGLSPCTLYTVSVSAATSKGFGPTADVYATTATGAPGQVTELQVDAIQDQSSQLQACWTQPETNCDLQYTVTWTPADGGGGPSTTNETCFTITGLTPFTTYSVCVAAGTLDDKFGAAQCADGTTDEGVPEAPQGVTVVSHTSESLMISWGVPAVANGDITSYEVRWEPDNTEVDGGVVTLTGDTTQHNITGLFPCVTYTVSVAAATSKGYGDAADTAGTTDSPPCPSAFQSVGCRCLWFDSGEAGPWDLSRGMCRLFYGDMVKINSLDLLIEVVNYIKNNGIETTYWLGATDPKQDDKWIWPDSSSVRMGTPFWGYKMDECQMPSCADEYCAAIGPSHFYYFQTLSCEAEASPLCEFPVKVAP